MPGSTILKVPSDSTLMASEPEWLVCRIPLTFTIPLMVIMDTLVIRPPELISRPLQYSIPVAERSEAEGLKVAVGLYWLETMARLQAEDETGKPLPDGRILLEVEN